VTTDDLDERIARAQTAVDGDRVTELCCALVDVASPTGDEATLAASIARLLSGAGASAVGLAARDDRQAGAWGRVGGRNDGPSVLLYAPIDTMTTGDPRHDLPHVARSIEPHLLPRAVVVGGPVGPRVVGLGAMNPKGHAACILAAVEAIARSGIELDGDVIAGFGAGGMPTNALPELDGDPQRDDTGHGVGCVALLDALDHDGMAIDAAVIAKSGWSVSWEEVGLAWFDVTVHGTHTYVGARHLIPYRNPIADAARVVLLLETFFAERAERWTAEHPDSYVEPQGIVGAITAGWDRMVAFTPASARVRVDVRLAPEQSPADARCELATALAPLIDEGVELDVTEVVGIAGSRTDPDHPIVAAAIDAFEAETGSPHVAMRRTSGATDANILRHRGIPTARVGLPKALADDGGPLGFAEGMNTVDAAALESFTRYLVRVALTATSRVQERAGVTR
jgi:acetylornithine deacetylase/succinyl-diaminopimelate desuccinylase-like protein